MTRNEFIRRLKRGLSGLPAADQDEVVADYEAHFDAGAAEGRSDVEVAEALGNPSRLARELRDRALDVSTALGEGFLDPLRRDLVEAQGERLDDARQVACEAAQLIDDDRRKDHH